MTSLHLTILNSSIEQSPKVITNTNLTQNNSMQKNIKEKYLVATNISLGFKKDRESIDINNIVIRT